MVYRIQYKHKGTKMIRFVSEQNMAFSCGAEETYRYFFIFNHETKCSEYTDRTKENFYKYSPVSFKINNGQNQIDRVNDLMYVKVHEGFDELFRILPCCRKCLWNTQCIRANIDDPNIPIEVRRSREIFILRWCDRVVDCVLETD